jgi:hypothetical protein
VWVERHDWSWHEAQLADTEVNGRVSVDGGQIIPRWRWLQWRRETMASLDREPEAFRRLVHEHNLAPAREMRRQLDLTTRERCPHGRWVGNCPQCHYQRAKGAQTRDGGVIERQDSRRAAAVLERARRRDDAG